MFKQQSSFFYVWPFIVGTLFSSQPSAAFEPACHNTQRADLNSTWRGSLVAPNAYETLSFEIPSAGLLFAEVARPSHVTDSAWLGLVEETCGEGTANVAIIESYSSRLSLTVAEAGTLKLRVSVQDPNISEYRVSTHFVPLAPFSGSFQTSLRSADGHRNLEADVHWSQLRDLQERPISERVLIRSARISNKTEMEEIDPNPGGFTVLPNLTIDAAWLVPDRSSGKTEMEEIDPIPGGFTTGSTPHMSAWVTISNADSQKTEMEEIDPNPGGFTAPETEPVNGLSFRIELPSHLSIAASESREALIRLLVEATYQQLVQDKRRPAPSFAELLGACKLADGDDHLDTFACATPIVLGESLAGELSNGWGDDADVFTFSLDRYSAVGIEAKGDTPVMGALYDDTGRRLGAGIDSTELQLFEELGPGRYYVRIESRDKSIGAYRLSVRSRR